MMKNVILLIASLIAFISCNKNDNAQSQNQAEVVDSIKITTLKDSDLNTSEVLDSNIQKTSNTVMIINVNKIKLDTSVYKFFKDTSFANLHLYSPDLHRNTSQLFMGNSIPGKYFKYFKANDFELEYQKGGYKIFACYKFKFNFNKTALIVRVPSQYEETAIRLIIISEKNIIEDNFEIANEFGDGGWSFNKDAWIENNHTDSLLLNSRKRDRWMDDDNTDITYYRDSLETYIYLNPNFRMVRGLFNKDTLRYKLKYW
jgi:hypothetical protein